MKGYGQYCPLALAAEILSERWTLLVLREIILGARRFNDIQRGVPRMSPSLLSLRLKSLKKAGIVERQQGDRNTSGYVLTEAGAELAPLITGLGAWGKRWLPASLKRADADPRLVLWDMHRRLNFPRLPAARTVVRFNFSDQPKARRFCWLLADRSGAELCITDPGLEVDLFVATDGLSITRVWYGDLPIKRALADGTIELDGPRHLREEFPFWLQLSVLAPVERWRPLAGLQHNASRFEAPRPIR